MTLTQQRLVAHLEHRGPMTEAALAAVFGDVRDALRTCERVEMAGGLWRAVPLPIAVSARHFETQVAAVRLAQTFTSGG